MKLFSEEQLNFLNEQVVWKSLWNSKVLAKHINVDKEDFASSAISIQNGKYLVAVLSFSFTNSERFS